MFRFARVYVSLFSVIFSLVIGRSVASAETCEPLFRGALREQAERSEKFEKFEKSEKSLGRFEELALSIMQSLEFRRADLLHAIAKPLGAKGSQASRGLLRLVDTYSRQILPLQDAERDNELMLQTADSA